MLVTYVYFIFVLICPCCTSDNISCINLCTWGPFSNSALVVLYMLVTNIGKAFFVFFSSVLMVSIRNFPEMCLFFVCSSTWLLVIVSVNIFLFQIFSRYFLSPSLSQMVPLCMIWFSSLLLFFRLWYNLFSLTLSFFLLLHQLTCLSYLASFLPPFLFL